MANSKNGLCAWLTCLGVLVAIGLLVWVLVKQQECCKKNEGYREYSGGFSGTAGGLYGGDSSA